MFFALFYVVVYVSRKNEKFDRAGGGWVLSGQSEFFSDFWIFINLIKPLSLLSDCSDLFVGHQRFLKVFSYKSITIVMGVFATNKNN